MSYFAKFTLSYLAAYALLVALLTFCFFNYARADDPGPQAPCFWLLSDGWDIMILKNRGLSKDKILNEIPKDHPLAQSRITLVERAYAEAEGDGWEWVVAEHRACLKRVQNGEPAGY